MFRNIPCRKLKKLSSWRKISLATWEPPQDPSVYGTLEVDVQKALALIESFRKETGVKLTITHLIIKMMGLTLAKYPELNVLIRHRNIYLRDSVDIFVQVFLEEGGKPDLSGAVIRGADKKSLKEIAEELVRRAGSIRQRTEQELGKSKEGLRGLPVMFLARLLRFLGWICYDCNINPKLFGLARDAFGAVMVTNAGMFGIKFGFAPLVPFSHTPILIAVGEVTEKPVAIDGKIVIRPMVTLGITADHRIIDGYLGGLASKLMKDLLENPEQLL